MYDEQYSSLNSEEGQTGQAVIKTKEWAPPLFHCGGIKRDTPDTFFVLSCFPNQLMSSKMEFLRPYDTILRLLNKDKMAASTSSRVCSSSMFLMKWNEIMESFLIDEVEKLPYLWNPMHPHFTKRLKKNWISADCHEDEREVAGTRSFLHASGSDCFDKIPPNYRQSQFGVDNNATATAYVLKKVCIAKFKNLRTYYRNEKQKLSPFRSGTGARDLVPKWEHFARLQFLDATIKHHLIVPQI
ncbi:hypothetical protein TNCV_2712351 [Trichonephila clavipes]|nr:hypothetical protein TNCV_2712351 [Trichonephila clavipes]